MKKYRGYPCPCLAHSASAGHAFQLKAEAIANIQETCGYPDSPNFVHTGRGDTGSDRRVKSVSNHRCPLFRLIHLSSPLHDGQ